jgi:hypothetical protein
MRLEVGGMQFQQFLSNESEHSDYQPPTCNLQPPTSSRRSLKDKILFIMSRPSLSLGVIWGFETTFGVEKTTHPKTA